MNGMFFNSVMEYSFNYSIRSIYDGIRSYESVETPIELSKDLFIESLRYFVSNDIAKLFFRDDLISVPNPEELDSLSLEEQLTYIYNTFPTEYDENIQEKDIDNLWWYGNCPANIGWKQADGSYFISY